VGLQPGYVKMDDDDDSSSSFFFFAREDRK
jgi:hypothetical protein